ncbi:GDP-mannose 4,6-dehydratase [Amylibacter sp.]|nr:GDP-mannose 4,6-dehydratase [Amylibacter sp.]
MTGVNGQDGSYLAEFLLDKGYEVHGTLRRSSLFNTSRIDHLDTNNNFHTHYSDLTDSSSLCRLINEIKPIEVYNLGAQSHVKVSFDIPEYTGQVDGLGTTRLLEAIRGSGLATKFYQASTSELFGGIEATAPQCEMTPFYPKSPYGAAKIYSYWIVKNYRESYGMHASNGILFNHESPRRGETFVTRKIAIEVAKIAKGKSEKFSLGNLNSIRDWGYAKEYVEAMWLMLQQDKADDYVIGTGVASTIRDFVEWCFQEIGIRLEWRGQNVEEIGVDQSTGKILVDVDRKFFRPSEVDYLLANPDKALTNLKWKTKTSARDLAKIMMAAELENVT